MSEPQHRYALKPGHKIHWYEIRNILGKGGFGITYLAHDLNLDKAVAIKEYLPTEFAIRENDQTVSPLSDETQALFSWGLDRFIKEAQTLSRFEHPNIVRVYAVFEENRTGYMVMAYEHGRSLKQILDEQRTLSETTLLQMFIPILDGLEQVHKQGFIHRDIKPDNIYIREDGSPVLLDFGSARQSLGSDQTMTSLISPGYAPFEQYYAKGEEQGPWTDVYSLGATLYRAVTGHKLNDAVFRSRVVLERQVESDETAVKQAKGNYSEGFLRAIDHAIQIRPQDRPQSVSQWCEELRQSDQTQIHHRSKPSLRNAGKTETIVDNQKSSHGKKILWLGGGAMVTVMVVLAALFVANPRQSFLNSAPKSLPTSEDLQPNTQADRTHTLWKLEQDKPIPEKNNDIEETVDASISPQQSEEPLNERQHSKAVQQAKLLEEQQKVIQQEAEIKRKAEEKLAAAQAEEKRRRIERQKRLEQQRLEEKTRKAEIERKIAQSNSVIESRMAKSMDIFGFSDYKQAEKLSLAKQKISKLVVPASTSQWLSTGVKTERGKTYHIIASGDWKMGKFCNKTDATGAGMYTVGCWDSAKKTVGGYPHGALIGKIGKEGLAFYVGPEFQFTAGKEGTFYLMSNDAAAFISDNSGELNVQVKLVEN